MSQYC